MSEIISKVEMDSAFERELCRGFEFEKSLEHVRAEKARAEARKARGHKTIKGLGKQVLELPSREFFRLRDKYGADAFNDRQFIRDMQRLEPDTKVYSA